MQRRDDFLDRVMFIRRRLLRSHIKIYDRKISRVKTYLCFITLPNYCIDFDISVHIALFYFDCVGKTHSQIRSWDQLILSDECSYLLKETTVCP